MDLTKVAEHLGTLKGANLLAIITIEQLLQSNTGLSGRTNIEDTLKVLRAARETTKDTWEETKS